MALITLSPVSLCPRTHVAASWQSPTQHAFPQTSLLQGTEFYDAGSKRYVDFPITDVLQMMGRAGRPQYDRHGVAVIMVHEPKKQFYKRFLYEPFPVESSLQDQVADHFNAEVVAGTIGSKQDIVDYLTWTFFFRRLMQVGCSGFGRNALF